VLPPCPAAALGLAVIGAAGLLYVLTAARDIVVGDTTELIAVAATLGVAHAPGYPLFTLLGHTLTWLPLGPIPFRVNLLAVVCSIGTAALVYLTAWQLSRDRVAPALAALALAVTPLFWAWALVAEVFSLNNLLAAALIYLLVLWQARPGQTGLLLVAAFVAGLSLANHHTIVLLGPAVLYLLWRQRRVLLRRPQVLIGCVGAVALGLLPYLYVPWAAGREPFMSWGNVTSLEAFRDLVTRASYGTGQLVSVAGYQGGAPLDRVAALLASFTLLADGLLLLGAVQAYRVQRWYFWFALLAFAAAGPLFVAYANINLAVPAALFVLERFFLLAHVVLAPLMAFGVLLAAELLARGVRRRAPAEAAVALGVGAAALALVLVHCAALDQRENHVARHFGEDILASLEPGALLLAGGDEALLPLAYLQAVEGRRPDVTLVMLPLLAGEWYVDQLRARHPDLVVPFARHDGRGNTMKPLVDANQGRPIGLVGAVLDDSLRGSYWYYYRGLVGQIEPLAKDVGLPQMASDNERLLAHYRPPAADAIDPRTFERGILVQYAAVPNRVGLEYERAQRYADARTWYERALAIDPELRVAQDALARIAASVSDQVSALPRP
jgi:hypothetical protein